MLLLNMCCVMQELWYLCVFQSEHLPHVDNVGCIQVLAAAHTLYLSLQVSVHKWWNMFFIAYVTS